MAFKLGTQSLAKAKEKLEALDRRLARYREKTEETTGKLLRTATIGGTSFGLGVIQGRTGGVEVFNVPLEGIIGAVGLVGGLMGAAGKHSNVLTDVGDAAIGALAFTMGRGVGADWAQKAAAPGAALPTPAAPAAPAATSGIHLNPAEVQAAMANLARTQGFIPVP